MLLSRSFQVFVHVTLFLALALSISIFADPVLGTEITGTILLPSGTAPAGGININIGANDRSDGSRYYYSNAFIPAGSFSATYSITIPNDAAVSWSVFYDYSGDAYVQEGYYASAGTTWDWSAATLLTGGQNHSNIDMTLLTGKTVAGTVFLPSGTAPAEGVFIDIYGPGSSYFGGYISEGSSSVTYSMIVPDDIAVSWSVSYSYWGSDYVQQGYYASAGTTWDLNAATMLAGGQDHSSIDMTLLTGKTIAGTVLIPSGIVPAGESYLYINALNVNGSSYAGIYIPAGSSSATYNMTVPDDATASWEVSYSLYVYPVSGDANVYEGYYASTGTTMNQNDATLLAGGRNYSGIDLRILPTNSFSWNMFLAAIIGRTDL